MYNFKRLKIQNFLHFNFNLYKLVLHIIHGDFLDNYGFTIELIEEFRFSQCSLKIADGVFYGSQLLFGAAVARGEAARCGEAAANGGATAALSGGAAVAGLVVAARVVAACVVAARGGGAAAVRGGGAAAAALGGAAAARVGGAAAVRKNILGDPEVTANIYCKSHNLPNTDTQNYSTDLR